MCILLFIGLALNENCLKEINATTFWMWVIKIYLILVGLYLELCFMFIFYMVYVGCREDFYVRDY